MLRSYDHLQEHNTLLARITQLTTDPLFWITVNIIEISLMTRCLVDMVAVLVYNFHVPLSLKIKQFVQRRLSDCNFLWCYVYSSFFSICVVGAPHANLPNVWGTTQIILVLQVLCTFIDSHSKYTTWIIRSLRSAGDMPPCTCRWLHDDFPLGSRSCPPYITGGGPEVRHWLWQLLYCWWYC
jgi:hypothetical protein